MKRKLTYIESFLLLTPLLALGVTMYWYFDPPWLEDALFRRSPSTEGTERLVQQTAGANAVDCGSADAAIGRMGSFVRVDQADGCAISNFKANRAFRVKYSAYMNSTNSNDILNVYSEVRAWSPRRGMLVVRRVRFVQDRGAEYSVKRCSRAHVDWAETVTASGLSATHETVGCP